MAGKNLGVVLHCTLNMKINNMLIAEKKCKKTERECPYVRPSRGEQVVHFYALEDC